VVDFLSELNLTDDCLDGYYWILKVVSINIEMVIVLKVTMEDKKKMNQSKKLIGLIVIVFFCAFVSFTLYRWVRFGIIDGGSIIISFISLSFLFNWLNSGNHNGIKEDKDELDKHIEAHSAKIGYYALMIVACLILFVSEGVSNLNDMKNYPLILVVGLAFVIAPIIEFVYSKKVR